MEALVKCIALFSDQNFYSFKKFVKYKVLLILCLDQHQKFSADPILSNLKIVYFLSWLGKNWRERIAEIDKENIQVGCLFFYFNNQLKKYIFFDVTVRSQAVFTI